MKRLFAACVLILSGLLPAGQALAWNTKGHMAIAAVAYSRLSRAERAKVFALLKSHPDFPRLSKLAGPPEGADYEVRLFMYAACWADFIRDGDARFYDEQSPDPRPTRRLYGFPDMGTHWHWHYKPRGFRDDGSEVALADAAFADDVQSKISDFKTALADPGVSDTHKGYFLAWLEHAVGDAHQPMHCATRVAPDAPQGDAFGSQFEIFPITVRGAEKPAANLHDLWDSLLGEDSSPRDVMLLVKRAEESNPHESAAQLAEGEWVEESFEYAKKMAYAPFVGRSSKRFPDWAYFDIVEMLLLERVKLAGQRLAGVLRQSLVGYAPPAPAPDKGATLHEPAAQAGAQASAGFFTVPVRATPEQARLMQESAQAVARHMKELRVDVYRVERIWPAQRRKMSLLAAAGAARQDALDAVERVGRPEDDSTRAAKLFFGDIVARYDEHLEVVRKSGPREYKAMRDRTLQLLRANYLAFEGAAKGRPLTFDLEVVSAPEGAGISYMRKGDAGYASDGKKTSVTLRNIVRAIWYFRAELPGYKTQEKSFDPYRETSNVLTFQLEPEPPPPPAPKGADGGRARPEQKRKRARARRP